MDTTTHRTDQQSGHVATLTIDLQIWAMQLDPEHAAELHSALRQETEALVYETTFDCDTASLPAVRDAQRRAVRAALSGEYPGAQQPTVTIEAGQVSLT